MFRQKNRTPDRGLSSPKSEVRFTFGETQIQWGNQVLLRYPLPFLLAFLYSEDEVLSNGLNYAALKSSS